MEWWYSRTPPRGSTVGGRSSGTTDDESVPSAGLVMEMRMMRPEEPRPDDPLGPLDYLKAIPSEPAAWSDRLGWVGLKAARYYATPAFKFHPPALTHHMFILY